MTPPGRKEESKGSKAEEGGGGEGKGEGGMNSPEWRRLSRDHLGDLGTLTYAAARRGGRAGNDKDATL